LRPSISLLAGAAITGALIITPAVAAAPASAATASSHVSGSSHTSRSKIPDAPTVGDFYIVNYNSLGIDEGLCLGITGGEDEKPAVQWTCNESANQTWHWGEELGTTGFWQLINGDGECLGVAGGSEDEGADIVGWTCLGTGHKDQYWTPDTTYDYEGFLPIFNYKSSYVVGVAGNSTAIGASVVQWHFEDELNNQFWELASTSGS
jgi:hypothetical protein